MVREGLLQEIRGMLRASPVAALIGPRQCGKTTLAREFVTPGGAKYFDLEDPVSQARLAEPMTALQPLRGLVVIDEIQRRPDLFPALRVLADRRPLARTLPPARTAGGSLEARRRTCCVRVLRPWPAASPFWRWAAFP